MASGCLHAGKLPVRPWAAVYCLVGRGF
jgi:hypothetical protein